MATSRRRRIKTTQSIPWDRRFTLFSFGSNDIESPSSSRCIYLQHPIDALFIWNKMCINSRFPLVNNSFFLCSDWPSARRFRVHSWSLHECLYLQSACVRSSTVGTMNATSNLPHTHTHTNHTRTYADTAMNVSCFLALVFKLFLTFSSPLAYFFSLMFHFISHYLLFDSPHAFLPLLSWNKKKKISTEEEKARCTLNSSDCKWLNESRRLTIVRLI